MCSGSLLLFCNFLCCFSKKNCKFKIPVDFPSKNKFWNSDCVETREIWNYRKSFILHCPIWNLQILNHIFLRLHKYWKLKIEDVVFFSSTSLHWKPYLWHLPKLLACFSYHIKCIFSLLILILEIFCFATKNNQRKCWKWLF